MSKACFDCPFNLTDCYRPQCITGTGIKRQLISVNKQMPGPAIQVCKNDQVVVNIFNELRMGESTSIHWHGMKQKGTPYSDGISMISQCPINSHTSFQYKYIANDPGTHLWHSHSGLQRADGLFGAIIVRQNEQDEILSYLYDYDLSEHLIVMNDWYDDPIAYNFALHVHTDRTRFNWADSILINGRGSLSPKVNFTLDSKNYTLPDAVFKVNSDYRYRFRLVHAGISHCAFQFSIQNHNLKIIATDGNFVEPFDVEALLIYPGERFDVVLHANQSKNSIHSINVKGHGNCENTKSFQSASLIYGDCVDCKKPIFTYDTLHVEGKEFNNFEISLDSKSSNKNIDFMSIKGLSKEKPDLRLKNKQVDKKFYIGMSFELVNNPELNSENLYPINFVKPINRYYMPQLNHISMHMPSAPLLYQMNSIKESFFCNHSNINDVCPSYEKKLCSCIHMIRVELNNTVEFVIVHEKDKENHKNIPTLHTMHIHGYSFAIVGMGQFNNVDQLYLKDVKDMDSAGLLERSLEASPVLKDTIMVPRFGYTIVRFIADNPGVWLFHCHFDFHSETGMTLVVKVGNNQDLAPKPKNWPSCGSFSFERSDHNVVESNQAEAE